MAAWGQGTSSLFQGWIPMLRVLGRSAPPLTNCRASSPAAGGKHDELGPETRAGRGGGQNPSEKLARAPVLIRTQGRTSEPGWLSEAIRPITLQAEREREVSSDSNRLRTYLCSLTKNNPHSQHPCPTSQRPVISIWVPGRSPSKEVSCS